MDNQYSSMQDLFKQLGLPNQCSEIKTFIEEHSPLSDSILLENAPWWSEMQKMFLHDELVKDADWAEAIDQLNSQLRLTPKADSF